MILIKYLYIRINVLQISQDEQLSSAQVEWAKFAHVPPLPSATKPVPRSFSALYMKPVLYEIYTKWRREVILSWVVESAPKSA